MNDAAIMFGIVGCEICFFAGLWLGLQFERKPTPVDGGAEHGG